jgi:FkbM family methyltransferase
MNLITKILSDIAGIRRICGWRVALRWAFNVAVSLPECLRSASLQPADRRMGAGPFRAATGNGHALLMGSQVFSGLREIWVRDVYLRGGFLDIPPGALVVDLGANLGSFTLRALAAAPGVKVIAVEPSLSWSESLKKTVALNGWSSQVVVRRCFVGVETNVQKKDIIDNPDYKTAPYLTEVELFGDNPSPVIDFLKCDIEGSEFFMIERTSTLLSKAKRLAIEIHSWGGSVDAFLEHARSIGFDFGPITRERDGTCIAVGRNRSLA